MQAFLVVFLLSLQVLPHAENTPYFPENFTRASITMKQGRVLNNVQARINLMTQTVHLFSNGIETNMNRGVVKQVLFTDSSREETRQYLLRSGMPAVDQQTADHFYFVLADGKCAFLKCMGKRYTERGTGAMYETSMSSPNGEKEKNIETTEAFYLFINGAMKKWKRDKESILTELSEKKEELSAFAERNKTNFRNEESVAKLVNYYNSL